MQLRPKDHREEVALFRHQVIGGLACREFARGDLSAELDALSQVRFRPPGSSATRTFSVPTLERWYYALKGGGLEALKPRARSDCGHGHGLMPALREILLDIRRDIDYVGRERREQRVSRRMPRFGRRIPRFGRRSSS